MKGRALRRHHLRRMKKKAIKLYKNKQYKSDPEKTIKIANNLKSCSCNMCCNPRRSKLFNKKDKLTRQERRSILTEIYHG